MSTRLDPESESPQPASGRRLRPRGLAMELLSAAACLILGILVMPCLIFVIGRVSLGPYEHGGVFGLWRDFLAGLGAGSEPFWFVALAPYALFWLLRGGRRLLHN